MVCRLLLLVMLNSLDVFRSSQRGDDGPKVSEVHWPEQPYTPEPRLGNLEGKAWHLLSAVIFNTYQ